MPEHAKVLIVAHETAATGPLIEAVRARAEQGNVKFHLVVPRQAHGLHRVVDPQDVGEEPAHQVLADALPKLSAAAGQDVTGSIGDSEPLMAIEDAVNLGGFHEIIISTHPRGVSRWLKMDLISKARGLGLPVTHVHPQTTPEAS
jgi:hypothetical protein